LGLAFEWVLLTDLLVLVVDRPFCSEFATNSKPFVIHGYVLKAVSFDPRSVWHNQTSIEGDGHLKPRFAV
jgi:hypothetical protein